MSYDQIETVPSGNEFKQLICRAVTCKHNISAEVLCGLDFGLEIEDNGSCIHFGPIEENEG